MENKIIDEETLRNLYLRTLLTGERLGPLTGRPSVDKPWLSSYTNEEIIEKIPKRRMYKDLLEYSKSHINNIAIEYYGNKITYSDLINNIDNVAGSFKCLGIKEGDVVSVIMPYLPETVYSIYALNKIGAVINIVDPRINKELMSDYIYNSNTKYAIIIDKIEEKVSNIAENNNNLSEIISVSPANSVKNKLIKYASKFKSSKFKKWNDIIHKASALEAPYKENDLAVIEYTSGTSGKPKGVMLSNESFTSLAYFQKQSLKNEVGDKFLLIMPPFIAYGLVIGMHDMLCQGQQLIMIPNFTLDNAPKMLGKLMDKHKPSYIMGVPNFLTILMEYDKDLSFLKGIVIGGDHLDKEIERKANDFFENHNSKAKVLKGWGMTEVASCATFTKTDSKNNLGSVGIPLSKNNVKVLPIREDKKYNINDTEVYYNEKGLLFISSPSMTLGYLNNHQATNDIMHVDENGKVWINTGDIFKIGDDGSLYFCGREKRVVVRPDGHNIPSDEIENIATSFDEIRDAIVVGIPSLEYDHGNVAVLCVTANNDKMSAEEQREILDLIKDKSHLCLQPRDRAKYYLVLKKLPYTPNGKIDYIGLTEYVKNIINEKIINGIEDEKLALIEDVDNKKVRRRKK